nr:MAG TPA: hypothetical protein [Caudoviricetes sp.]
MIHLVGYHYILIRSPHYCPARSMQNFSLIENLLSHNLQIQFRNLVYEELNPLCQCNYNKVLQQSSFPYACKFHKAYNPFHLSKNLSLILLQILNSLNRLLKSVPFLGHFLTSPV